MRNLLNQRIEEISGPMTLLNESFSKETILDKTLSNSRFYKCEFKNIIFENVVFRKSEFSQCIFQNCQILRSDLTRTEFDNSSFTSCEFKQVDLSNGLFCDVQFSETKFEEILLVRLILSNLKIKTTTFGNLHFSEKYPVRIRKLNKVKEVSDFNSFQEAFSLENQKTQNLAILEKSCDLDDSFFQTKINLDRLIERNYKILFWVALAASGFLLVNLI